MTRRGTRHGAVRRAAYTAGATARGLWCECLHLKRVGIHDNFFDLGGDSLAMIRLSLAIEQATGQGCPLPWIFDAPTVAGMAALARAARSRLPAIRRWCCCGPVIRGAAGVHGASDQRQHHAIDPDRERRFPGARQYMAFRQKASMDRRCRVDGSMRWRIVT